MPTWKDFQNSRSIERIGVKAILNCSSSGLVYVAKCPCNLVSVGKNIRSMKIRILEHIGDIALNRNNLMPQDMWERHGEKLDHLQFWGLKMGNWDLERVLID